MEYVLENCVRMCVLTQREMMILIVMEHINIISPVATPPAFIITKVLAKDYVDISTIIILSVALRERTFPGRTIM